MRQHIYRRMLQKVSHPGQEPPSRTTSSSGWSKIVLRPTQSGPLGISWRTRTWKSWVGHSKFGYEPHRHRAHGTPRNLMAARLFHAPTRTTSSGCFMLHRTVHALWNLYGNPYKISCRKGRRNRHVIGKS